MNAFEKIGFASIIATAATIGGAAVAVAREIADKNNKSFETEHKLDETERKLRNAESKLDEIKREQQRAHEEYVHKLERQLLERTATNDNTESRIKNLKDKI